MYGVLADPGLNELISQPALAVCTVSSTSKVPAKSMKDPTPAYFESNYAYDRSMIS
jgi:hypothetical protein